MPVFKHELLTTTPAEMDVISTPIGDNTNQAKYDFDIGKAVKKGPLQNYVLCADGDEIGGFIDSVRGDTVNGGHAFGGVQRRKRVWAEVGDGVVAVNDFVVAAAQIPWGTKGTAQVKTGNPSVYKWQAIRVDGSGAVGSKVLLERE
jgi:hypothetical protein